MKRRRAGVHSPFEACMPCMLATITVGTENTDVINVSIQLKDADANDVTSRQSIRAYLSDDANGDSLIASVHSGAVAIGTDGLAIELVTKKCWQLVSEADGDIDINITEAGTKTAYLVLVMPDGTLFVSGAITHAA
jgi:hypothetical protein